MIPLGHILVMIVDVFAPSLLHVNLNIDENLPNYFDALEDIDRENMIAEEENLR